jgi:hypothetical protein
MNTLTQGKLNELKRLLRYPNDPITNDTFWNNRETLIAAAEEGLKVEAASFGADAKAVLDVWVSRGGVQTDPSLGYLQAYIQFHINTLRGEIADNLKVLEESAVLVNKLDNEKQDLRAEVQRLIDETHRWSAAERKAKVDHEEDKKALRTRVQELERHLGNCHHLALLKWGNLDPDADKLITAAGEALSNSTRQPPRYTLDQIQQAFCDVATKSEQQAMCGLIGGAVIRQLTSPEPQQKEEA